MPCNEETNRLPDDLFLKFQQTFGHTLLERYGMKAVISDPLDTNLTAVAKGQRQDIVDIVHQAMDGTAPDPSSIDKELGDYVKTVKVIMGESLFSDSYLEI